MAELINARGSYINAKVKFILANGEEFELSSNTDKTYLTSIELEEKLSSETDCPVGVISSRVLDLELNSIDKLLIPDNENSQYYGFMNDTAKIELYITEDGEQRFFGRYYVNEWNSDISSSSPNRVVISATDIMSRICKMEVPPISINSNGNIKIKDYLIDVFNTINEKLDEADRVIINSSNVDFTTFQNMIYCNLNMNNIGDMLNCIAQSTITNIYIDRDNILHTDFCCDDTKLEAKYAINIMTAAKLVGMYANYDGISIIYDRVVPEEITRIASMKDVDLFIGEENKIDGLKFDAPVYKVNRIEVQVADTNTLAYVSDEAYTRNSINLTINTNRNTQGTISVYGQQMSSSEILYEVGGKNKMEMHCSILEEQYVAKYSELLLKLMQIKNNGLQIKTYINTNIKLGDIVYVDAGNAMDIKGYYKIIGIDWDISVYGEAKLTLIKTFSIEYNLDTLLLSQITLLFKRLLGINVSNKMNDISYQENKYAESKLGELLDKLR